MQTTKSKLLEDPAQVAPEPVPEQQRTPESPASVRVNADQATEHVFSGGTTETENILRQPHSDGSHGEDIVTELRELLGHDVVLIPVHAGKKRPVHNGWTQTTLASMIDPAYVASLHRGNIGVALGANSGGLCAVDLDVDEDVEAFLTLNPKLRATLRTRGARGAQFWVRLTGGYPKLAKLKTYDGEDRGEWRSDGGQSVIHGVHEHGMRYQRLVDAPPAEIAFDDIAWPEHLKLPWIKDEYERLVEEHGEPYEVSASGTLRTNDYFFVARFQREHPLLWEPLEEEFYEYDADRGLWTIVSADRLRWRLGEDLKRTADETGARQFLWQRNDGKLGSLVHSLRGAAEKRDAFKKRVPVIHFANGMLDLQHSPPQLVSFHPDYCSRNLCPIAFDPRAECPRFLDELLRSALDEDDIDLLQRWAGSVLLGTNPAQRVLMLIGTAGGGKSTLIEVIEKVIGERNVAQLRTKHLHNQFELYRFLGKTLLTGKDVNANCLSEEGAEVIKALVGNDLLDAEKKRGNEPFQLRGSFNVAITCNSRLRVRLEGDAGAWERRLMIINYNKPKPQERVTEFADQLIRAEAPGILNWMIKGAIRYQQEMRERGDFFLTDAQQQRTELILAESDSVRRFVRDRVVPCENADVSVNELQQAYFAYCEDMGWQACGGRDFNLSIADLMLEVHHVLRRNDISRGIGLDRKGAVRGFKNLTILEGGR